MRQSTLFVGCDAPQSNNFSVSGVYRELVDSVSPIFSSAFLALSNQLVSLVFSTELIHEVY